MRGVENRLSCKEYATSCAVNVNEGVKKAFQAELEGLRDPKAYFAAGAAGAAAGATAVPVAVEVGADAAVEVGAVCSVGFGASCFWQPTINTVATNNAAMIAKIFFILFTPFQSHESRQRVWRNKDESDDNAVPKEMLCGKVRD